MNDELYEIIIASLLHDIGKFKQRAYDNKKHNKFPSTMEGIIQPVGQGGKYSHQHALWTYDFFENDIDNHKHLLNLDWRKIKDLASKHHKPSTDDEKIIDIADNISAAGDRVSDDDNHFKSGDYLKRYLKPVFPHIDISDLKQEPENYIYDLKELGVNAVYPRAGVKEDHSLADKYRNLWDKFLADFEKLCSQKLQQNNIDLFIQSLIYLLEKYTWCIPSATNDKFNDISLFDHSITTAAIALAMKIYNNDKDDSLEDDKKFLFFAADISGIQQFIFQNHRDSFKGSSKIIRGRSFYVSAISQAYLYALCNELDMPPFAQMMNAGGRFTLLLPNIPAIEDKINEFTAKADEWLLKEYHGEFAIVYDYSVKASEKDIGISNFKNIIHNINFRLSQAKRNKFSKILTQGNCVIDVKYTDAKICKSCGKYSSIPNNETSICERCADMLKIGERIIRDPIISFEKRSHCDIDFFDGLIGVNFESDADIIKSPAALFSFNESDTSIPVWNLNNYVPKNQNGVLSFDEIAESSLNKDINENGEISKEGSRFLSYIKIDVDNLGNIFGFGIKEMSVSRYTALSRMLNLFFNPVLKDMLSNEFPDFYTVLSGGDDLFLIAPWDCTIDFVDELESRFKQFVCQNPDVHFSTGIYMDRPKSPMSKSAFRAEDKIEIAKDKGRNRITFFEVMGYEELRNVHNKAKWLIERAKDKDSRIKSGFLHRFLEDARKARRVYGAEVKETRMEDYAFIPRFRYDVARNIVRKQNNEVVNKDEVDSLVNFFDDYSCKKPHLLETIIKIALYKIRKSSEKKEVSND